MRTKKHELNRRGFLKAAAGAVAAPYVITSAALGGKGKPAASERIGMGHIGVGGRGSGVMGGFLGLKDCQCIAVADAFNSRRRRAAQRADSRYGGKVCKAYADFRELLADKDVDGVVIATPDHWHVPIAIAAAKAGKDMYVEKPLGLCAAWNLKAREAIQRYGVMFQYGTQQRSSGHLRQACELVLNGRIGQLKKIEVHAPAGRGGGSTTPIPVPEDLDYNMWLGPAPKSPYTKDRCTANGTYHVYDNAIGFIAGWGAHPLDIAVWGWDLKDAVPVEIEGTGKIPTEGLFNSITHWNVKGRYANGVQFEFKDGSDLTIFYGTKGTVQVGRSRGKFKTDPVSLATSKIGPDERHLPVSTHHGQNLLDAMKTRSQPVSNIVDAVRSDTISHLSDIAIRTGRKIQWDPVKEQIVDDDQAARMLNRPLRAPWRL